MRNILIVDDHPEIVELLIEVLKEEYKISSSASGSKAVRIAKKSPPDLIIMDIMMPGRINGLEATKIIKSTEECINTKIIVLSAKIKEQDKIEAIKAGASIFMEKPFNPQKLLINIEKMINNPI